jgi:nitrogen-specific signal transduction histidine kinase
VECDRTENGDRDTETLLLLAEMASAVTHSLNTPLTGMMLAASRLKKILKDAVGQEKALSIVERLSNSIDDLGETVKKVGGYVKKARFEYKQLNVNNILATALSIVSEAAKARNIEVNRELVPSLPDISANAGLLERAFLNLMTHSLEGMQSSGSIVVVTRAADNNQVEVLMSDTRRDVDLTKMELLLNKPFSIGNVSLADLRLCVARRIVELHLGSVTLQRRKDSGIEVVMSFPAVAAQDERQ